MHLFGKNADFEAFQRVMIEAHQRHPIRILSYCVMGSDRPPPAKSAAGGVHRTDTKLYSPICQNGSILQPNPPITLDNPDRFRGSFL